ncbi:MAG: hypothetical protein AB1668_04915 [Nanoarchaeota archaeon]
MGEEGKNIAAKNIATLLVESSSNKSWLINSRLGERGYTSVRRVMEWEDVMPHVINHQPQLILIGARVQKREGHEPEGQKYRRGYEACREIKGRFPGIAIIGMDERSNSDSEKMWTERYGADGFMSYGTATLQPETLDTLIQDVLRKYQPST